MFFRNSACLGCGAALGYDVAAGALWPIEPDPAQPTLWRVALDASQPGHETAGGLRWQRCAELDSTAGCNWLVAADPTTDAAAEPLAHRPLRCRCCELLRTTPQTTGDVWQDDAFLRIERARRRLVSSLIALQLPVGPRLSNAPPFGLAFDVLAAAPGGRVITGHADGVITLDLAEAEDAVRERRRAELREPYRTLLGHLRHESGHYYWQRLVDGTDWLQPFRRVFGDERQDYGHALRLYYDGGAAPDWPLRFVSAYASAHPWEDFAETWAHYLHLLDMVDTAHSFGLDASAVEIDAEPFAADVLSGALDGVSDDSPDKREQFVQRVRDWTELTAVLNELARSMGVNDLYPFVLSAAAVRKLYFVHGVVTGASQGRTVA